MPVVIEPRCTTKRMEWAAGPLRKEEDDRYLALLDIVSEVVDFHGAADVTLQQSFKL